MATLPDKYQIDSLEQLRDAMIAADPRTLDRHHQWRSDLPTFGGEEWEGTHGVWSWDADRLLIGDSAAELRIVDRESDDDPNWNPDL